MDGLVFEEKQQKVLDVFFKEVFAKSNIHFGYWFVAGMMIFFQGIFMCIPWQALTDEDKSIMWMVLLLCGVGSVLYLLPYIQCVNGKGMVDMVYNRLKYLPMSAKMLRNYRFKKLFRFQKKVYLAMQILQFFFSAAIMHKVGVGNVLYPLLFCFVFPLFVSGISILTRK